MFDSYRYVELRSVKVDLLELGHFVVAVAYPFLACIFSILSLNFLASARARVNVSWSLVERVCLNGPILSPFNHG